MNQKVKGIIGALLGALIFSIPWVIVYVYLNYILSILALLIAYGSLLFYKKFGGIITKKTSVLITISSLLAITVSTFLIMPILLIAKEGNGLDLSYLEVLYASKEFTTALTHDYIISVIFTFLGIGGIIANINKEAYTNKIDTSNANSEEDITKATLEEQIKYIEKIYEKYDAFSKEASVPSNIITLDLSNKVSLFYKMKKLGYIVTSSFNKTYFDKDALDNPVKAKRNAKNNTLKPALLTVLLIIILGFVLIIVSPEEDNDIDPDNNITEKLYIYGNISLTLPNTFKEDTHYTDYKTYSNYDLNSYVFQIMLDENTYSKEEYTTSKEYYEAYLEYLKESFAIIETSESTLNSYLGYKVLSSSIEYPDEHYYTFITFDKNNVYTTLYFTSTEEINISKEEYLNNFKKEVESYQKTLKINNKKDSPIVSG